MAERVRRVLVLVLSLACAFGVAAQELSSQRDYTDNAQRDLPGLETLQLPLLDDTPGKARR